jgi:hypothetical protein
MFEINLKNEADMLIWKTKYELEWLSNSFYKDGLINSATLGIGVKF